METNIVRFERSGLTSSGFFSQLQYIY